MIWSIIWYYLFALFTAADVITTQVALSMGMREVNPFMAAHIDYIIPIKIAVLLLMAGFIIHIERSHNGQGWLVPSGAACVTFAAVVWNVGQIGGVM